MNHIEQAMNVQCTLPIDQHATVQQSHGSGGRLMNEMIHALFKTRFQNKYLDQMNDGATLPALQGRLVFTTDTFVVQPIFFPGGNIGELAVYGTVNDLCMCGARPLYLSAGFILEEGLAFADLEQVVNAMAAAAHRSNVMIVTGDTKVVERGKADKLFINTAGIGVLEHDLTISANNLQPGDRVILSGSIGQHGLAVLSKREGLKLQAAIESDTAPLNTMVESLLRECGAGIHAMRDATRGGVAAVLHEFAAASGVEIKIEENSIPVHAAVQNGCHLLGLDPLYIANEGKMIAVVAEQAAEKALATMRQDPLGREAEIIGEVAAATESRVSIKTLLGAWRIVPWPSGELLPRIC